MAQNLTSFHQKFLLYTASISFRTHGTHETLSKTSKGEEEKTMVSVTLSQTLHKQNYSHTAGGVPFDNREIMTLGERQLF